MIESMVVIKKKTPSLPLLPLSKSTLWPPNEVNLPTPGLTSDGTHECVEHHLKESI